MPRAHHTFWVPQSLLPSPGWRAVYFIDGVHVETPVHALALARPLRVDRATGRPSPDPRDETLWDVVGLEYSPGDTWNICSDANNFCAYLPPELSFETWELEPTCTHTPQEE